MTARQKKERTSEDFFLGVKATKKTKEGDYYILSFSIIPSETLITITH